MLTLLKWLFKKSHSWRESLNTDVVLIWRERKLNQKITQKGLLQVLRSCKWPIGKTVDVVDMTDISLFGVCKKILGVLDLPYIHP